MSLHAVVMETPFKLLAKIYAKYIREMFEITFNLFNINFYLLSGITFCITVFACIDIKVFQVLLEKHGECAFMKQ